MAFITHSAFVHFFLFNIKTVFPKVRFLFHSHIFNKYIFYFLNFFFPAVSTFYSCFFFICLIPYFLFSFLVYYLLSHFYSPLVLLSFYLGPRLFLLVLYNVFLRHFKRNFPFPSSFLFVVSFFSVLISYFFFLFLSFVHLQNIVSFSPSFHVVLILYIVFVYFFFSLYISRFRFAHTLISASFLLHFYFLASFSKKNIEESIKLPSKFYRLLIRD